MFALAGDRHSDYAHAAGLVALGQLTATKRRAAETIAEMAGTSRLDTVIDVGSGDGELAYRLCRRLPDIERWVLVDLDRGLLTRSRRRLRRVCGDVTAIAADMDEHPFGSLPSGTAVVLAHVLYYSADWRVLLGRWLASRAAFLAIVVRSAGSCSFLLRSAVRRTPEGVRTGLVAEKVESALSENGAKFTIARLVSTYRPGLDRDDLECRPDRLRSLLVSRADCARLLSLWCHSHPADLDDGQLLALRACMLKMIQSGEVVFTVEDMVIGCHSDHERIYDLAPS
ncbi:class I SAM-dependent methyltransferase [Thermopolyspora sp. NPDC052614]|uniref:class I SAM-dependent methyltransferase n=1 Tax=Thermopolyspora sp. NPDC052614 TaxID=3155682 RepID=UPI00341EE091